MSNLLITMCSLSQRQNCKSAWTDTKNSFDVRQFLHHMKGNVFMTQHMFYLMLFAFSPALLTTTCDVAAAFGSLQTDSAMVLSLTFAIFIWSPLCHPRNPRHQGLLEKLTAALCAIPKLFGRALYFARLCTNHFLPLLYVYGNHNRNIDKAQKEFDAGHWKKLWKRAQANAAIGRARLERKPRNNAPRSEEQKIKYTTTLLKVGTYAKQTRSSRKSSSPLLTTQQLKYYQISTLFALWTSIVNICLVMRMLWGFGEVRWEQMSWPED